MSITRLEIEYYKNIGRIADALESLVAQGKQATSDMSIKRLTAASDLLYGNSKSPLKKHYKSNSTINNFKPTITTDQDERIYKESQSLTGGEFSAWYNNLTQSEKQSYQRVYNH